MTAFLQACGAILIAVVLILSLGNQDKQMGLLLSLAVCTMVALIAMHYLEPIIEFVEHLEQIGGLNGMMIEILLKAAGIGILSEIIGLVCSDSGNASLGKALQLLSSAVILWLSIPLFTALIDLIQKILGEL